MRISVIIPALNEEESISLVINEIPGYVNEIIVVDNGSKDNTPEVARNTGAKVISEKKKGYGHACLAGISVVSAPDIIVFLDGDYSDYPGDINLLVDPIISEGYDFVVGSRIKRRENNAIPIHSVAANIFFGILIQILYGVKFTDLGPFRAIKYDRLLELGMQHGAYGWTAEMQVKAAKMGFKIKEVNVRYRRRLGTSKVTGSPRASITAAIVIFWTILKLRF